MADLEDDWEAEFEKANTNDNNTDNKNKENEIIESEDYQKPEQKQKEVVIPKEKAKDYEQIYNDKHKERITKKKIAEQAVEGLDDKTKLIKLEEQRKLDDIDDFMGGEKTITKSDITKEQPIKPLNVEKDFIDLAVLNVSRVKSAGKPSKFTLTYLKQNLDLLAPTLEADKIDSLIKDLTVMFNKKRKEESEKSGKKTNKNKAPNINTGNVRKAEKMTFDDNEEFHGEEEDYDEDDFM
jgi:hypothetical protein